MKNIIIAILIITLAIVLRIATFHPAPDFSLANKIYQEYLNAKKNNEFTFVDRGSEPGFITYFEIVDSGNLISPNGVWLKISSSGAYLSPKCFSTVPVTQEECEEVIGRAFKVSGLHY